MAEKRLQKNPFDTEAWSIIIREAQKKKIAEARVHYEKLVDQFPSAGRYWKLYIEHEMNSRNYDRAEKLFHRCLVKILNIDLWQCYLAYVKQTKGNLPSYRELMAQAYDFALEKIGKDFASYPIWNNYITFLKNVEASGSYAENQRIMAVRNIYHRGIANPMTNIEHLWKDYVAYEQSINPLIAEKMIQEKSDVYMNARRVSREYESVTRGINRNAVSTPPQGLPQEIKQVDLWKKYIVWEKCNPLRTEDESIIRKRVMFAYEKCLLCKGHHPDIWYEAASYLEESSKRIEKVNLNSAKILGDEAASLYERATSGLLKNNMFLHFAYADFEEGRMKYDKVHQIYNKFIELNDIDPTLAYIQYMKFTRRTEGIESARAVFKKAREDTRPKYHVYVAAALMEYHCTKDKMISSRIFQLGLKKHADNPDYIHAYIDHLSHLNDNNNTRVLFEQILKSGSLTPEKSISIWNKYLELESNFGDFSSMLKVEKRRAAVIDQLKEYEVKETALLVNRYKFLDIYPCTTSELQSFGYKEEDQQHVKMTTTINKNSSLLNGDRNKKPTYARPDTSLMVPFKPKRVYPNGAHPLPGGVFPPPPASSSLMTRLPPPACFHGPFVVVDDLIALFQKASIPENFAPQPQTNDLPEKSKQFFEHAVKTNSDSKKRKLSTDGNIEDCEDEDKVVTPPVNIYRSRQQKKIKISEKFSSGRTFRA